MPGPFSIVPALLVAAVLIASAIAKLRHPDDLKGWEQLGVPAALRREWVLRLHPWGEIALGLALAVFGGLLGLLAALAAVALMGAYTWLVGRTWRENRRTAAAGADPASCACFGQQRPVTAVTLARNVWLLALALAAASGTWVNPLLGGPLAAVGADWAWIAGLAAAGVTAMLILWPDAGPAAAEPKPAAFATSSDADELDYIRTRTPAVPVMQADGTTVNLRSLTSSRPMLLVAISDICGACQPVIDQIPAWRELLPEVDVRMLLVVPPEQSRLTELTEPQTLHDLDGYVRGSIAEWATPAAVLLGMDGLLAGGPVEGVPRVEAFVAEIHETLHGSPAPS